MGNGGQREEPAAGAKRFRREGEQRSRLNANSISSRSWMVVPRAEAEDSFRSARNRRWHGSESFSFADGVAAHSPSQGRGRVPFARDCYIERTHRVRQRSSRISQIIAATGFAEKSYSPVSDDWHVDAIDPRQQLAQAAIGGTQRDVAKQFRGADTERRVTIAARLLGQR